MWKLQQALTSILCDIVRQWGHAPAASGVRLLKHWQCVFQELICAPRNLFQLIILSNAFCSCNFFCQICNLSVQYAHCICCYVVVIYLFCRNVVVVNEFDKLEDNPMITTAVQVILKYNINNLGNHTNDHKKMECKI